MVKNLFLIAIAALLFCSCNKIIKPEELHGKWKYIKVGNPHIASDSVSSSQLEMDEPYIVFSKNDSMMIWWGGRVLSHGTYKLDGATIHVKEVLDSVKKTRDFNFYILKLEGKDLEFETTGNDGTRVTAVKQ